MLIETKHLSKSYGKHEALRDLNLQIEAGELIAYIGTNGAGKSTTMKLLTGLLAPTSGQVYRKENLKIGIVFQDSILDDRLRVEENLRLRQSLYQGSDNDWYALLLDRLRVKEFLHQTYGSLSGGQRRRVDILRALLHKPDLLFLDEPTTGLDIQSRQDIWNLLYQLRQEEGLTIFLTTHYLEEAELADKVFVLEKGQVLAEGSAQDLIATYSQSELLLTLSEPLQTAFDYQVLSDRQIILRGLTSKEALALLAQEKERIENFAFKPGDINSAFVSITGKEWQA